MTSSLATGNRLEDLAVEYLQQAGVIILHRNFRSNFGEIDLIAQDGTTLVFIEVRYRKNANFGTAAETVTNDKQQKIIHTAQFFLQTRNWANALACRFDVLAMSNSEHAPNIDWIKDAFNA